MELARRQARVRCALYCMSWRAGRKRAWPPKGCHCLCEEIKGACFEDGKCGNNKCCGDASRLHETVTAWGWGGLRLWGEIAARTAGSVPLPKRCTSVQCGSAEAVVGLAKCI
jgi:hypothetical protein